MPVSLTTMPTAADATRASGLPWPGSKPESSTDVWVDDAAAGTTLDAYVEDEAPVSP